MMRIVASEPDSKPVPEAIAGLLDSVSSDHLREVVESLSVPRVYGTDENAAVRRQIIERFSMQTPDGRASPCGRRAGR